MTSLKKDKNLSGMLILCALGFILYLAGSDEGLVLKSSMTIIDSIPAILELYLDIVIISYIFICLQIAGYLELKHKQDFLIMSLISILFTPFATFFVYRNKDDNA
tara:strand:+ start:286 stop:600 length:315 start_codon:yes stop_codon:yes gene_type:complete